MTEPTFEIEQTLIDLVTVVSSLHPRRNAVLPVELTAAMARIQRLAISLGIPVFQSEVKQEN
jgi:hypothetical protein